MRPAHPYRCQARRDSRAAVAQALGRREARSRGETPRLPDPAPSAPREPRRATIALAASVVGAWLVAIAVAVFIVWVAGLVPGVVR